MRRQRKRPKLVIGVTGSFGSGKSTVAGMFQGLGACVIDADKIARRVVSPGGGCYKKLIHTFGPGILKKGRVDRARLARLVFAEARLLRKLNRITHPAIIRIIKQDIRRAKKALVVLDAPLLIEAGLRKAVDKLIVVKVSKDTQLKRLRQKGLKTNEIILRVKSQMPLSRKVRLADFIIDNNGTVEKTRKQVAQIRRQLWKS
jgi:dephospho-CoA kinase